MKISFAITVSNEVEEIKKLFLFLFEKKRTEDEIVVLFDEKNGNEEVIESLLPYNNNDDIKIWSNSGFNYDFAEWKNKLNEYCDGDFVFQLDADEMVSEYIVKNIHEIVSLNNDTDLLFLPRINTVEGITENHLEKWGWRMDDKGRINHPDYQGRVYRKGLKWVGRVHERIDSKSYSLLPFDEIEYSILHHKTINKQEKQNNLYNNI
jgi:hypothetical protein